MNSSGNAVVVPLMQTNWKWLLVRAVFTLLFGVIALWSPLSAVFALTFVFGAYAVVDGVLSIVMGFHHSRSTSERWWSLILRGALAVFAGIAVLLVPWIAAITLTTFTWIMLAMWALAGGLFEFLAGRRLHRETGGGGWLLMISGLLSVLLGVLLPVLLIKNPVAGMVTIGLLAGVYALSSGVMLFVLALKLRKTN